MTDNPLADDIGALLIAAVRVVCAPTDDGQRLLAEEVRAVIDRHGHQPALRRLVQITRGGIAEVATATGRTRRQVADDHSRYCPSARMADWLRDVLATDGVPPDPPHDDTVPPEIGLVFAHVANCVALASHDNTTAGPTVRLTQASTRPRHQRPRSRGPSRRRR